MSAVRPRPSPIPRTVAAARRALAALLALLLGAAPALAQDGLDGALFGGDGPVVRDAEESDRDADAELLERPGVAIGGRFSLEARLELDLAPDEGEDALASGLADLGVRLFLDARPTRDLRVFVSSDVGYSTVDGVALDLREAFADIDIADTVFVRAGKQTVTWGAGLFFSPANLINLERIDPEDPDAELAGPVAVKAQLPLGTDNLTGYLLLDDLDGSAVAGARDAGLAARYETLVEGFEVTTGALWRPGAPWALMATATGALGDVSVFAEAVLEGNGDRTYVVEAPGAPLGIATETRAARVFVSGTVGGSYRWRSGDDRYGVDAGAQLFYNGDGYADPTVLSANRAAVGALLAAGELTPADLRERGRLYAATRVGSPDLAGSDVTPSLFWLGNLGDGSGLATVTVSYDGAPHLTPSLEYRWNYGPEGGEYSPDGPGHRLSLGFALRGSF